LLVKRGGLGIQTASQTALPAFWASVVGSAPLTVELLPTRLKETAGLDNGDFLAGVETWKSRSNADNISLASVAGQQKHWSSPSAEITLERMMSAAPNQAG
jgi:hypothetical protein